MALALRTCALFAAPLLASLPTTRVASEDGGHRHEAKVPWTFLFYGAVANSAEESFVPDVEAMRAAMGFGGAIECVFLVDRSAGFSQDAGGFGEDFDDTRLYRFDGGEPVREDGGLELPELAAGASWDADMGDAETLARFVRWAKARHPAERYALVFYSHGSGGTFCPDEESGGDVLHPAELTDALGPEEAVDLVVFDVCSMGGIENLYQWRPGNGGFAADVVVATPNAGFPFPWPAILAGLRPGGPAAGDTAAAVDPATISGPADWRTEGGLDATAMTAAELGGWIVEVTRRFREVGVEHAPPRMAEELRGEAQACYDLARAADVKRAMDALAVRLAAGGEDAKYALEALRGEGDERPTMDYFVPREDSWSRMPYFDLYDLLDRVSLDGGFSDDVRDAARAARDATDALVLASFGMDRYEGFRVGKNGCYVVFPDGDAPAVSGTQWARFAWLVPGEAREGYGRYAWCGDGATEGDGVVQTWFELLDAWYDDPDQDVNGYRP